MPCRVNFSPLQLYVHVRTAELCQDIELEPAKVATPLKRVLEELKYSGGYYAQDCDQTHLKASRLAVSPKPKTYWGIGVVWGEWAKTKLTVTGVRFALN
jgi:hypothetical protein